jgi:PAS domain S-box-containing protein
MQDQRRPWLSIGIVIAVIAVLAGLYYRQDRANTRRAKEEDLRTITLMKINEVARWMEECDRDAEILADDEIFSQRLAEIIYRKKTSEATKEFERWSKAYLRHPSYNKILVLDSIGKIRFVQDLLHKTNRLDQGLFLRAKRQRKVISSGIISFIEEKVIFSQYYIPLLTIERSESTCVAVIVLQTDPATALFPSLQQWETQHPLTELVIAKSDSAGIMYINDLRFKNNTAFNLRFSYSQENILMIQAIKHPEKQFFEGVDYRSIPAIAYSMNVPNTDWRFIVKSDLEEVYENADKNLPVIVFVSVLMMALVGVAIQSYYRRENIRFYQQQYELESKRFATVKHFEYLTKYANDIILLANSAGAIIEANQRAEDVYRYQREELLALNIDAIDKGLRERLGRTGEGSIYESDHRTKDGCFVPVEVSQRSIEVEGNYFVQYIIRDITERKKNQEILRESEARFHSLFSNMEEGVAIHKMESDNQGKLHNYRILDINPAYERHTGVKREAIVGKLATEAYGVAEAPYLSEYSGVAETGKSITFETYFGPTDRWFYISVISPRKGMFATVFLDITERMKSTEAIQGLNEQIMTKNVELEQLIYIASHDLRSPLVNIQGFSKELEQALKDLMQILDTLSRDETITNRVTALDDEINTSLQYIKSSTTKMDMLLNGLLRLSRIARTPMVPVRLDVNNLISQILMSLKFQISQKKVDVSVGTLPPCMGDEGLMSQVFSNLIENALKFLNPDRSGSIEINGSMKDDCVIYCVADNGIGISPEQHKKIFEIFYQVNEKKFGGEGLGLTIVQRIVERHQGTVTLESTPGEGSLFTITLPKQLASVQQPL